MNVRVDNTDMPSVASKALAKEAANWRRNRKTLKGPDNRDHFIIEPEGQLWRLSIYPLKGLHRVKNGLTFPEANRQRLKLSDAGFIGKVAV